MRFQAPTFVSLMTVFALIGCGSRPEFQEKPKDTRQIDGTYRIASDSMSESASAFEETTYSDLQINNGVVSLRNWEEDQNGEAHPVATLSVLTNAAYDLRPERSTVKATSKVPAVNDVITMLSGEAARVGVSGEDLILTATVDGKKMSRRLVRIPENASQVKVEKVQKARFEMDAALFNLLQKTQGKEYKLVRREDRPERASSDEEHETPQNSVKMPQQLVTNEELESLQTVSKKRASVTTTTTTTLPPVQLDTRVMTGEDIKETVKDLNGETSLELAKLQIQSDSKVLINGTRSGELRFKLLKASAAAKTSRLFAQIKTNDGNAEKEFVAAMVTKEDGTLILVSVQRVAGQRVTITRTYQVVTTAGLSQISASPAMAK